MEPIESSETSAYINTLTPGTYPKEKKLQSKHGESLKSRKVHALCMLDKSGKNTVALKQYLIIIAFPLPAMVMRTLFNTLYVSFRYCPAFISIIGEDFILRHRILTGCGSNSLFPDVMRPVRK